MPMNAYKVLFFIDRSEPTASERSEALNFGPHVSFRNIAHIDHEGSLEDCNAVYGVVPPQYAKKFPWACSIVDFYGGKLDKLPMGVATATDGDEPSEGVEAPDFDPFAPGASAGAADWQKQG